MKTAESGQGNLSFSNNFEIFILCSTIHFLEGSTRVLLKVATNDYLKKPLKISIYEAIILKQKRKSATKVIVVLVVILEVLYLVQLHFFDSECTRFTESSYLWFI